MVHFNFLQETQTYTIENLAHGLQDFLICLEMVFAAILHMNAFSPHDFDEDSETLRALKEKRYSTILTRQETASDLLLRGNAEDTNVFGHLGSALYFADIVTDVRNVVKNKRKKKRSKSKVPDSLDSTSTNNSIATNGTNGTNGSTPAADTDTNATAIQTATDISPPAAPDSLAAPHARTNAGGSDSSDTATPIANRKRKPKVGNGTTIGAIAAAAGIRVDDEDVDVDVDAAANGDDANNDSERKDRQTQALSRALSHAQRQPPQAKPNNTTNTKSDPSSNATTDVEVVSFAAKRAAVMASLAGQKPPGLLPPVPTPPH
jgi:hypothetical protein